MGLGAIGSVVTSNTGDWRFESLHEQIFQIISQLHNFDDFPYFHPPRYYCPKKPFKNCDLNQIEGCQLTITSEKCYNKWTKVIKQLENKTKNHD